jgi:hypothetical protein
MSTASVNIVAIGQAAIALRTSVAHLNKAADAIGVRPAMTINGIPFLDADDVERLREALNNQTPFETMNLKRGEPNQ